MCPEGFESESFTGATSESRALMRSGYGEPEPKSPAERASARLAQAGELRERELAEEERTGTLSTRSASLNMSAGYARNDARRAGVDVYDDVEDDNDPDPDPEGGE